MKKLLSVNNDSNAVSLGILIARVFIAGLMLTHGLPKLTMLMSGAPVKFPGVLGLSPELALGLAVFTEVICSIFLLTGLATRIATIPLMITMLVAAFIVHAADPLGTKEPALQYLLVYTVLLFTGSGKYSVDYLLTRTQEASTQGGYSSPKRSTLAVTS